MSHQIHDKIISWLPNELIEENVRTQLYNVAEMSFVQPYIAVMPDCHLGMGASVGSVIPTQEAIMPSTIGVDIGCGMLALNTRIKRQDMPKDLEPLRANIQRRIPLGVGHNNTQAQMRSTEIRNASEKMKRKAGDRLAIYDQVAPKWREQLGSLGSGNHFIEVVVDETDDVWVFLHSGSRGIGNKLAMKHIKIAEAEMREKKVELVDKSLAYLEEGTQTFDDYIFDLLWSQDYASWNREILMSRVLISMYDEGILSPDPDCGEVVACHHNFTALEKHFGKEMWVSRKGAIRAYAWQRGLIPGSMGTASYVVQGRGNEESFKSAPHGAGRRFSRGEAKRRFTMEDFDIAMEGIEAERNSAFIDELPGAYKDIDVVMQHSEELVTVAHKFRQLLNVKGE